MAAGDGDAVTHPVGKCEACNRPLNSDDVYSTDTEDGVRVCHACEKAVHVAIDPALIEAVRRADAAAVAAHGAKSQDTAAWLAARVKDVDSRIALADAVLAQFAAKESNPDG